METEEEEGGSAKTQKENGERRQIPLFIPFEFPLEHSWICRAREKNPYTTSYNYIHSIH